MQSTEFESSSLSVKAKSPKLKKSISLDNGGSLTLKNTTFNNGGTSLLREEEESPEIVRSRLRTSPAIVLQTFRDSKLASPTTCLQPKLQRAVSKDDSDAEYISKSIRRIKQGSNLTRIKKGGRSKLKKFYVDEQEMCILWKPSKKNEKAKIPLDIVHEVREGKTTDGFQLSSENLHCEDSCCFSLLYINTHESVNLVAETSDVAKAWITGLRHLLVNISEEDKLARRNRLWDQWLKTTFAAADKSGDGLLSLNEVTSLLHKLNVNINKRKVRQMFKDAVATENYLDYDSFVIFYQRLGIRKDLFLIMQEFSSDSYHLTIEELKSFLEKAQRMENVTLEQCEKIIEMFEPEPEILKKQMLGIDGFTQYMMSPAGDIFNSAHLKVNQDMRRPLSDYFIAASHNTYLIGDQLLSQSSVDIYAFVLQAGCRCVELDCWDGKEGEPVIYHGYTLTSKIRFKEVILTINKYAFVSSCYPVILSIENHCTVEQQKKMAQYLTEIFGDKLQVEPLPESSVFLPSPESLKGKILIKTKKLPVDFDSSLEVGEVSDDEDSADEMEDDFKLFTGSLKDHFRRKEIEAAASAKLKKMQIAHAELDATAPASLGSPVKAASSLRRWLSLKGRKSNQEEKSEATGLANRSMRKLRLSNNFQVKIHKKSEPPLSNSQESSDYGSIEDSSDELPSNPLNSDLLVEDSAKEEETVAITSPKRKLSVVSRPINKRKGKILLAKKLSDLVTYTASVGFSDLTQQRNCWEMTSIGETKGTQVSVSKASQFVNFTYKNLTRVYPASYRIDSSNFNPQTMWNCGVQLVALNYQSEGKPMQLNNARFISNGNCGYVLKPEVMRTENTYFNPRSTDPIEGVQRKQLTLKIISGQHLPKPPDSLLGERGEIIDPYVQVEIIGLPADYAKKRTKTISDNGFNPNWEAVVSFVVNMPDLALVRMTVWDADPIGRDFIGQKTLPLSSFLPGYRHIYLEGLQQASLFVHVDISDYHEKHRTKWKSLFSNPGFRQLSETAAMSEGHCVRRNSLLSRLNMKPRSSSVPARRGSLTSLYTKVKNFREQSSSSIRRRESIDSRRSSRSSQAGSVTESIPEEVLNQDPSCPPSPDLSRQQYRATPAKILEKHCEKILDINDVMELLQEMSVSSLLCLIREKLLNVTVVRPSHIRTPKIYMENGICIPGTIPHKGRVVSVEIHLTKKQLSNLPTRAISIAHDARIFKSTASALEISPTDFQPRSIDRDLGKRQAESLAPSPCCRNSKAPKLDLEKKSLLEMGDCHHETGQTFGNGRLVAVTGTPECPVKTVRRTLDFSSSPSHNCRSESEEDSTILGTSPQTDEELKKKEIDRVLSSLLHSAQPRMRKSLSDSNLSRISAFDSALPLSTSEIDKSLFQHGNSCESKESSVTTALEVDELERDISAGCNNSIKAIEISQQETTSAQPSLALTYSDITQDDCLEVKSISISRTSLCSSHSSSSADTVIDMSLENLGKFTSSRGPRELECAPSGCRLSWSLENLTLKDIFEDSEYKVFVNNLKRGKQPQSAGVVGSYRPVVTKLGVRPYTDVQAKLKPSVIESRRSATTRKSSPSGADSLTEKLLKLVNIESTDVSEESTINRDEDHPSSIEESQSRNNSVSTDPKSPADGESGEGNQGVVLVAPYNCVRDVENNQSPGHRHGSLSDRSSQQRPWKSLPSTPVKQTSGGPPTIYNTPTKSDFQRLALVDSPGGVSRRRNFRKVMNRLQPPRSRSNSSDEGSPQAISPTSLNNPKKFFSKNMYSIPVAPVLPYNYKYNQRIVSNVREMQLQSTLKIPPTSLAGNHAPSSAQRRRQGSPEQSLSPINYVKKYEQPTLYNNNNNGDSPCTTKKQNPEICYLLHV